MNAKNATKHGKKLSAHAIILKPHPTSIELIDKLVADTMRKLEKSLAPAESNFIIMKYKANGKGEMSHSQRNKIKPCLQSKIYRVFKCNTLEKIYPDSKYVVYQRISSLTTCSNKIWAKNQDIGNSFDSYPEETIRLVTLLSTKSANRKNDVIQAGLRSKLGVDLEGHWIGSILRSGLGSA